ncbi:MAG TPA: DUF1934 domain-containing protein [Bacillota bacterium]|nr:DUF1934 domain-containing protein [Bacillota bacterium]HOK68955.1 DUF1934 domain-containing protein [Bacillota bacterium]HPP85405.1 DUF1934 domain-containing protein [Bacillota bacterium]
MKIPINIKIQSERIYNDLGMRGGQAIEPEISYANVTGYMKKTKDGLQVEYTEAGENGAGETVTTINTFGDNLVSVNRVGAMSSHMVFEKGKCHTCIYDTGVFPMQLRICTKELENRLTLEGGRLNINYSIEIVGNLAEQNKLTVSVYPNKEALTS